MTQLDDEQLSILRLHSISLSSVFDAAGMGHGKYGKAMGELGKEVAIGVTPCKKMGHTLRTRTGACLQCHPASITFLRRNSEDGYVYVAGSLNKKIIKIGLASVPSQRANSLNRQGYGGASDWFLLFYGYVEGAGKIEFLAHHELMEYAAPTTFQRDGRTIDCLETFQCRASMAINALIGCAQGRLSKEWKAKNISEYEFDSLVGNRFTRVGSHGDVARARPIVRSGGQHSLEGQPGQYSIGETASVQDKENRQVKTGYKRPARKEMTWWEREWWEREWPVLIFLLFLGGLFFINPLIGILAVVFGVAIARDRR